MMYQKFVNRVEKRLNEVFESTGVRCEKVDSMKNNGRNRIGIAFYDKNFTISPTIYMEEYFVRFLNTDGEEEGFERIISSICSLYHSVKVQDQFDTTRFDDFSNIKDKVIFRLINKEMNESFLKGVPHVLYMDLAIIFHVLVELDDEGDRMATMLLRNELIEKWEVSTSTLFKLALENTERLLPSELCDMFSILNESLPEWEAPEEEDFMYVLTNNRRSFGACTILYPHRLEVIGMFLKDNFFVLPSSTHEVIILPESKALGKEELAQVVKEINSTQVPEEEILSNNVYYYDIKKGQLEM